MPSGRGRTSVVLVSEDYYRTRGGDIHQSCEHVLDERLHLCDKLIRDLKRREGNSVIAARPLAAVATRWEFSSRPIQVSQPDADWMGRFLTWLDSLVDR